jgi:hypothetical protein
VIRTGGFEDDGSTGPTSDDDLLPRDTVVLHPTDLFDHSFSTTHQSDTTARTDEDETQGEPEYSYTLNWLIDVNPIADTALI